jgi:hypothetical protein
MPWLASLLYTHYTPTIHALNPLYTHLVHSWTSSEPHACTILGPMMRRAALEAFSKPETGLHSYLNT